MAPAAPMSSLGCRPTRWETGRKRCRRGLGGMFQGERAEKQLSQKYDIHTRCGCVNFGTARIILKQEYPCPAIEQTYVFSLSTSPARIILKREYPLFRSLTPRASPDNAAGITCNRHIKSKVQPAAVIVADNLDCFPLTPRSYLHIEVTRHLVGKPSCFLRAYPPDEPAVVVHVRVDDYADSRKRRWTVE